MVQLGRESMSDSGATEVDKAAEQEHRAAERLFSRLVRAAARDPAARAQFLNTLETYGFSAEQRLAFRRRFEGGRAL
jgi:thioredoxin-like negative regulator of GroEL